MVRVSPQLVTRGRVVEPSGGKEGRRRRDASGVGMASTSSRSRSAAERSAAQHSSGRSSRSFSARLGSTKRAVRSVRESWPVGAGAGAGAGLGLWGLERGGGRHQQSRRTQRSAEWLVVTQRRHPEKVAKPSLCLIVISDNLSPNQYR